jgi:hypothetical protein
MRGAVGAIEPAFRSKVFVLRIDKAPLRAIDHAFELRGAVAELVGIEGGVVSGVINLESSGVEASDWRPRHDEQ